jgi:hypothetical protein
LHTQLELLRLILPDMEETRALGKFMKAHPDTNPRDLRKAEQVSWHLLKVRRRAVLPPPLLPPPLLLLLLLLLLMLLLMMLLLLLLQRLLLLMPSVPAVPLHPLILTHAQQHTHRLFVSCCYLRLPPRTHSCRACSPASIASG